MSIYRQPSEWGIGKVKTLFSYLEYKVGKLITYPLISTEAHLGFGIGPILAVFIYRKI